MSASFLLEVTATCARSACSRTRRTGASKRGGGVEPPAEGAYGLARRVFLKELGNGPRQLAVAHRRRRRAQRADTENADDLVVMLIARSRNQPADTGQQSGYRHFILLDAPRWQQLCCVANLLSVKLKTPPALVMLTGSSCCCLNRMAEASALEQTIRGTRACSMRVGFNPSSVPQPLRATIATRRRCLCEIRRRRFMMRKTLA